MTENSGIFIQKVAPDQLRQLQQLARQTFFETFSDVNTPENMQMYLDENLSLDKLSKELSNRESEFYFALSNNIIAGYLKINFGGSQTELTDLNAVEIERIYVLKDHHSKGLGQSLLETAIYRAKAANAPYIWLGVWEENINAIRFYRKNGFVWFAKHIFRLGDDEQTDILMKLVL